MIQLLVRVSLALLVLNQLLTPCEGWGYGGRGGGENYGEGSEEAVKTNVADTMARYLTSKLNTTRRGLGISAWGIIILIVSLILAGMGFYYFSMCYPAFCIKKNKYDNMTGLPSVA